MMPILISSGVMMPGQLGPIKVVDRFERLSEIRQQDVHKAGRVVGRFYYRVGYKYRRPVEAPNGAIRR